MLLKTLQRLQAECDQSTLSIHGKPFSDLSPSELLAHKCFHLGKLLGKIAGVCEAVDHGQSIASDQIKNEVIPDLIIYSLQLANLYSIDLDQTFLTRVQYVFDKHPTSQSKQAKASHLKNLRAFLVDQNYENGYA